MNENGQLTDMEIKLLSAMHNRYDQRGFPELELLRVVSRYQTAAGRMVKFSHIGEFDCPDGELFGGQLDMPGLEYGATFFLGVAGRKVEYLEILVNGEENWDGEERDPVDLHLA